MVRSKMLALQIWNSAYRLCYGCNSFVNVKLYFIVLELSDSLEHTWILTNQTKVRCDIADSYTKMTKLAS